ncbi:MAG TPA: SDR family NAD(P)-dependent oxidoreductase [Candidatus Dormibacteraeota bacterium]
MRLKGASVLVTGASSGIGAATARLFARSGARLTICARRLDRLHEIADQCRHAGAEAVVVRRTDMTKPADVRAFVAGALRDFDRVDVLVNNAGVGWRGRFQDMPEEAMRLLIETNVTGLAMAVQAVLPSMLEANSGVIINVSSVVGFRATPYSAVYSATKHAVTGLSHALRGELSGTGVKVCAVYPGTTRTEFRGTDPPPQGVFVQRPEHVARAIVRTARWPRRDVIMIPYRLAHLAEPVLGGPLDHLLGELRRRGVEPPPGRPPGGASPTGGRS